MIPAKAITQSTISHYQNRARDFWEGTKDHDVTQNYQRFIAHLPKHTERSILDFGCGPGRDLYYFKQQGLTAIGLDGSEALCTMAQQYSGCEVLHQDFIALNLPENAFDGVFANASLFHTPKSELARVLLELHNTLKDDGILFSSNPRGSGERFPDSDYDLRYAYYLELDGYMNYINDAGFTLIEHYYRPSHLPIQERPWLACVMKKLS